MPAKRISMRKLRDVLRLAHQAQLSGREISRCLGLSHTTVRNYLYRAKQAGLTWPLPTALTDAALEAQLFAKAAVPSGQRKQPDWSKVHDELKAKGVTLQLLWEEYKRAHPEGYQYSWFCALYRNWKKRLDVVMRQDHAPGEKLFVDYAGMKVVV